MSNKIKEFKFTMADKNINVAVIACGNRSREVVNNLLVDSKQQVKVIAVYDPDPEEMTFACNRWNAVGVKHCQSSLEAINTPGVDWVMVFSPNAYHKQHILEAFNAGKDVFTEKPLATSIDDCKEIYDAYRKSGKLFATGFVLRYSKLYLKAKEILDSGKIGKLLAIEGNENIRPGHGGYIMCNWRRHTAQAGPHILEKCCHDLDLLNWFCGSLPSKVAAFGSLDFFIPENKHLEDKYGKGAFHVWRDPHKIDSPFSGDTDLMDHMITIAQYRNNIKVSFNATMANIIPERRMFFHCTEGNMILDVYTSTLRYRNLADEGETIIAFGADTHGGGDQFIMQDLYKCMCERCEPQCSGDEGLESAIYAMALDQAATTGTIVDLEPVWKKLNR